MNLIANLTPHQFRHAADIQESILALQSELAQLFGTSPQSSLAMPSRKRRLSAQGLANIRAGARKRWGKAKSKNGTVEEPTKARRKMSAAGKARISAQLKARWAAAKRAGRSSL
jgi:hypothetical protein